MSEQVESGNRRKAYGEAIRKIEDPAIPLLAREGDPERAIDRLFMERALSHESRQAQMDEYHRARDSLSEFDEGSDTEEELRSKLDEAYIRYEEAIHKIGEKLGVKVK